MQMQMQMETTLIHPTMPPVSAVSEQALPEPAWTEPRWYAAYTAARHEKKIATELARQRVESFLPLYASLRRWRDRRVQLELPLFPSYIFVHLPLVERLRVLQVPGVVRLVGFSCSPVPLPDAEISRIHCILQNQFRAEAHPYLTAGKRVRVKAGPLAGWEGTIVRRKNKNRFVVTVELLQRAVAIEVDGLELEHLR
jgi:transcription antitermination factor NusG